MHINGKIALILTVVALVTFSFLFYVNPVMAASPNVSSAPLVEGNTAYANVSATYYSIGETITGSTQFNPMENITPSTFNIDFIGSTFTFSQKSPLNLGADLGNYRYFAGNEVGYDQSLGLNLQIQYDQYGYGFVWFNLSFDYSGNNTVAGSYSYYSPPINITFSNFIYTVSPVWTPTLNNGYYSLFLTMSTGPYDGKVGNITAPSSSDSSIIGYGNYSSGSGHLTLSYPSNTQAFIFQYTSPYNVSLDGRTPSATFVKTYYGILPTFGDFTNAQGSPNTPYFDISWSLSNLVQKENATENISSNANVYHILYNFDANYSFALPTGSSWLNGAKIDNITWPTTFLVNVSHLIDTGVKENTSYNAFYLDGNLILSNHTYLNYSGVTTDDSGISGQPTYFEVVTEDQTNVYSQPPNGNPVLGIIIPSYAYSAGIGAVVAGIGITMAYVRGRKKS